MSHSPVCGFLSAQFPWCKLRFYQAYPDWARQLAAGGDNRDRTDDPLLAKQVLSQLSYTPVAITFLKVRYEPQKLNNECNLGLTA